MFIFKDSDDKKDFDKLNQDTQDTILLIEKITSVIGANNSKLIKLTSRDPTPLAKQIWQDVWSVSGATPEKCLYTFIELFIFKYLSDLEILDEDEFGNKVNFKNIIKLQPAKAFSNYSKNVRPLLRIMFPENKEDGTTIINGTVLHSKVPEHSDVFYKILTKFEKFGELKNIDPSFKSKVFEEFMKESLSTKKWGQVFTPRVVIDAIVEMSDIEKLPHGAKICDPACGVGGFLLEPMRVKENGLDYYYQVKNKKIKTRYIFYGFDKGFEKEEQLTIILAKANMLIFLSELLKKAPTLSTKFSKLFNETFRLYNDSILGSLAHNKREEYDLIMTNPPYAQKGSSNLKQAIKKDSELQDFFKIDANGVEGLFVEKIIRELKPNCKAFIITPHSIFDRINDKKLRKFIMQDCIIDAVISLPQKTFYKTRKKTYILCITKKNNSKIKQKTPVFTYLVTDIGESLDVYRVPIDDNDLTKVVTNYKYFMVGKKRYKSRNKKIKIQPISKFEKGIKNWCVDRWWRKDEKIALGIEEEEDILDVDEYKTRIEELSDRLTEINKSLSSYTSGKIDYVEEPLTKLFSISQGNSYYTKKRILQNGWIGAVPVYSSNTKEGGLLIKIKKDKILEKDRHYIPCLTWTIDGDAGTIFVRNQDNVKGRKLKKYLFTINNHCGILIPKKTGIDLRYMKIMLQPLFKSSYRSYDNKKVGTNQIVNIEVKVPVDNNGDYALDKQHEIAEKYKEIEKIKKEIQEQYDSITRAHVDLLES